MHRPDKYSYLYVPGKSPLKEKTVGQLADEAAYRFSGETLHAAFNGDRMTFRELKDESDQLAAGLLRLGLRPGDKIGIWGPNSRQWYVTYIAAAKAGLISVCLNMRYQGDELLYCLNKVGVNCIVIAGPWKHQDYFKILTDVCPELKQSSNNRNPQKNQSNSHHHHQPLTSRSVPSLRCVISMEAMENICSEVIMSYTQILEMGAEGNGSMKGELEKVASKIKSDDVFTIIFTSGSTGLPKGVAITHKFYVNSSHFDYKRYAITSKDKICLPVLFFTTYGNLAGIFVSLQFGACLVLPAPCHSPSAAIRVAAETKCTVMYGTTTMHIDMLNVPNFDSYDLSSLRLVVTSSGPSPPELMAKMRHQYKAAAVLNIYGLTETGTVSSCFVTDSAKTQHSTIGYPVEHSEVKIVDVENGQAVVPIGQQGELQYRSYGAMQCYWDEVDKTNEAVDDDGWFHTGDLCVMTKRGYLKLVGRLKDLINRGGENIFPKEIEQVLHSHPAIVDAHVFGVPHVRLGEAVAAWIRLRDGANMKQEDVVDFCKQKISQTKIPLYIKFTDKFPVTATGKVSKLVLRDTYILELTGQRPHA